MKRVAPLALFLALTVTACETGYKRSPVVTPQRMMCSGNRPAQITLYSPTDAVLAFDQKNYTLKRVETASGVQYGNDDITFWNKGIDAMITRDNGAVTTCTYIPRAGL